MAQKKGVDMDDSKMYIEKKPRVKGDKTGSKKKASKKSAR